MSLITTDDTQMSLEMSKDSLNNNVSMVNVYQIATDIGKDLESLIERFGSEDFRDLMPKIIRSLEYLEEAVKKVETKDGNIRNLEDKVAKAEQDLDMKTKKIDQLLHDAEEAAEKKREDDIFWMKQLSELQKENAILKDEVSEKEGIAVKEKVQEQEAVKVLMVMKQTVDKQRNQMRALEKEVTQKTADVDALQEQLERLAKLNQDLHKKNELIQLHAQSLIREKSQLITDIKVMEQDLTLQASGQEVEQGTEKQVTQSVMQTQDGYILIDPNDPNRPRFTLQELYAVLLERDELKLKLFLLEDDIESKGKKKSDESDPGLQEEKKTESSISKFFSSIFRTSKKKVAPQKDRDSSSSESNWEFLEKEDAPLDKSYADTVKTDSEVTLTKFFEKLNKSEDELEMSEMVSDHYSAVDGKRLPEKGGNDSDDVVGDSPIETDGLLVHRGDKDDEGTDVDRRDLNHNMNNNQNEDNQRREDDDAKCEEDEITPSSREEDDSVPTPVELQEGASQVVEDPQKNTSGLESSGDVVEL